MAEGSTRASATTPTFKPRLSELANTGPGRYRLHWHGGISAGKLQFPLNYKIDAQFVSLDDPAKVETLTLSLGTFPHLALGTIWENGVFEGHVDHEIRFVEVDFSTDAGSRLRAQRLDELLPSGSYPLHGLANPGWCRLIPTTDGSELIVPSAEILRAWYFFDSNVIPAVIGGAIKNPSVLSHRHLPWIPELTCELLPSGARIVHKNRLSIPSAQCLARLLFDSTARDTAAYISQWIRGKQSKPSIPLPPALPPFSGRANWTVRCQRIASADGEKPRYLILQLLSSDDALPYDRLERLNQTDLRAGTKIAEDLKKIYRNFTRNIFDDHDAISLWGEGIDDSLQGVSIIGLAFDNSATRVKTFVPAKEEQTHKGVWVEDDPVDVSKAGVDPTAEHEEGVPPGSQTNSARSDDEEDKREHDLEIAPFFEEVIKAVASHDELIDEEWAGDFPFDTRQVQITHPVKALTRSFIVARLSNGRRHIYLLDAEPFNSESFRVIAAETKNGAEISKLDLTQWLGTFPHRPGCPWTCAESQRIGLAIERMKHQQHRKGMTAEQTKEKFKIRLVKKLLEIIRK